MCSANVMCSMNAANLADAALIASMAASSILRIARIKGLSETRSLTVVNSVVDIPTVPALEMLQNLLSLLGTLLADRLRHSQGVFSLAQCTADCYTIAAMCPEQRVLTVAVYVAIFGTASAAYSWSSLQLVGWMCAWAMAVVSSILIANVASSTVVLSSMVLPGATNRFALERGLAFTAYSLYVGMLLFDEPAEVKGVGFLAAIPMFWPWLTNAMCNLISDGRLMAMTIARTMPEHRAAV